MVFSCGHFGLDAVAHVSVYITSQHHHEDVDVENVHDERWVFVARPFLPCLAND
jgi:hypothetical protein